MPIPKAQKPGPYQEAANEEMTNGMAAQPTTTAPSKTDQGGKGRPIAVPWEPIARLRSRGCAPGTSGWTSPRGALSATTPQGSRDVLGPHSIISRDCRTIGARILSISNGGPDLPSHTDSLKSRPEIASENPPTA